MRRLYVLLATVVMALTLIALAVATGASAQQKQPYGVLYSSDTLLHWDTGASKADADQNASALCQGANDGPCVFEVWVNDGWAAYTQGELPDGSISATTSWGETEQEVTADGMAACQDAGATNCTSETFETANTTKEARGGFK
jgi:hypothetical protein